MKFTLLILLLSSVANAAIYGVDNRMDINQVPALRPYAKSVAIAVATNFLHQKPNGSYEMEGIDSLASGNGANVCSNERFAKQSVIGNCTGFLVSKRRMVTAGHCVLPNGIVNNQKHPFCDGFSWYFDYNVDVNGKTSEKNIPAKNIYRCTRVIRAETIEINGEQRNDFAILELDRDVAPEFVPLKMSARIPSVNEQVYTIGHPTGLPAKFSGLSPVLSAKNPYHFVVNLDALGGNSGSPTFDRSGKVLGILISGHPIDYTPDPRGCNRVNKCDATGRVCKENTPFKGQQVSNYIQYNRAMAPYLFK